MNTFRQSFYLLKKNLRSIVGFEIVYRLFCIALMLPCVTACFQLSLRLAGYHYLSGDRIFSYLVRPTTIVILCFVLLLLSVITVFEIFCLIPAFHASYHGQTISLTDMLSRGLFILKKSIRQHNRSLFLFSLFLIPLTNITILSGYFTSVTIPDFILYYIRSNQTVFHVLCLILVICLLLAIRYCLSLHCYCLEPGSFKEARAHCKKLTRRHYFHTALQLLAWNILILAVLAVILLLCFMLSLFFVRFVLTDHFNSSTIYMIFSSILSFLFELYILFSIPLTFSYLSALYYRQLLKQKEEVPAPVPESRSVLVRISKRLLLLLVILAAGFNFYYLDLLKNTSIFWTQNILLSTPTITAHRGDSHNAPENTLAAFQSAIDNQADCIELDVQQTKDHVIVVVHDTNLKRLTGVNQNVSDLTYEELLSLDFGSHFSPAYKGEKICTLDEVLTLCKDRIDLNIELKTNISDTGLEAGVVALIESHDYAEHCVVAAKKPDSLKKIKSLDDSIQTIYLLPVAYGNYQNLSYIDGFSIKSSFITRKLVNHMHANGKAVYAWTVNEREDMERMFSLGIDCLITDEPVRAKEVLYSQELNPSIAIWLEQLTHHFLSD